MKGMSLRATGVLLVILAASAQAAIWPDRIADFERKPATSLSVSDRALYGEFGLETTEQADYVSPTAKFTATAWRMRDSTGALALFEFRRPAGAKPSKLAKLAVTTDDGVILAYGNYVLQFTGRAPTVAELTPTLETLPRLEQSQLPALITYIPAEGLIPNSERYVLGPVSLERFEPRIAPSLAAFHMGAEGQLGRYSSLSGGPETQLAVFSYPTPSMARERADAFSKIAGAMVKRTGSLVAIVLPPADPDTAERLLAKVNHQISLTFNETPKEQKAKGFLGMVNNAIIFSFIMMGFCLVAGIALGGLTVLRRKFGRPEDQGAMITLGLDGK